jgi:hypothetical protein
MGCEIASTLSFSSRIESRTWISAMDGSSNFCQGLRHAYRLCLSFPLLIRLLGVGLVFACRGLFCFLFVLRSFSCSILALLY